MSLPVLTFQSTVLGIVQNGFQYFIFLPRGVNSLVHDQPQDLLPISVSHESGLAVVDLKPFFHRYHKLGPKHPSVTLIFHGYHAVVKSSGRETLA